MSSGHVVIRSYYTFEHDAYSDSENQLCFTVATVLLSLQGAEWIIVEV